MRISADCFNDEEIKNYISSDGIVEHCDVLDRDSVKVINLDNFYDFFSDVFRMFKEEGSSKLSVADYLLRDWNLFQNKVVASKIITECKAMLGSALDVAHVTYIDAITDNVNKWEQIKHDLQFKSRYMTRIESYFPTDPDLSKCLTTVLLPAGTILYRARVLPDKVSYYKKNDLGCPPAEKVSNGRANPIGIPYLYLCAQKIQ